MALFSFPIATVRIFTVGLRVEQGLFISRSRLEVLDVPFPEA
ncbi:MAG: hypothetical protein QOF89_5908 [Acidobacteriota bacterium]|jgi:hypothetical protein|nr:hypothetical protein [Acidobacteriota bacterium]